MQEKPPEGSKIQYTRSVDSIQYSWEPQELKPLRYFFVGFLALFLVLSMVFGVMYVIQELSAETSFHLRLFLIVFLFMFTMIFSAFSVVLYFLIRPSKPVIITLSSELFEYQTGYCSSEMMQVFDHKTKLLPLIKGIKNRIYKVPWPEIHNLQLKRFGVKQRLSFDHEGQEINIGKHLTEPEQEWLFEILRERMESNEN